MGKDIKTSLNHGGFKHNYNSIRVLDVTQSKYEGINGLNLSWQVLEGILKHTKISRHGKNECKKCGKCWDIKRYVNDKKLVERLYLNHDFSVTLEGQIVAIADEIAQRQHDIDDGLRGLPSNIKIDDMYEMIIETSQELIAGFIILTNEKLGFEKEHPQDCIDLLNELIGRLKKNKASESRKYKKVSLVRNVLEYFILDVFATTKHNYNNVSKKQNYGIIPYTSQNDKIILDQKIVSFSNIAKKLDDSIENYIKTQIINSYDINKANGRSKYIIRQLFKAYYKNPLQMPHYMLRRLEKKLKHNSEFCSIKIRSNGYSEKRLEQIKFKDGDRTEIDSLVEILKFEKLDENIVNHKIIVLEDEYERKSEFKRINELNPDKLTSDNEKILKCLIENNYAYLSTICDYIASMTDNYAKKEFKDLYLVD